MTGNIWVDPASFVTSPPEADAVLRMLELPRIDHYLDALSKDGGIDLGNLRRLSANTLVAMTGEDHLKTRRVIAPFFSKTGLACWSGVLEGALNHALDRLAAASRPDLVADFTIPLFIEVMPRVLGLSIDASEERFRAIETVQRITEPYLSVPTLRKLDRAVGELITAFPDASAPSNEGQPETLLQCLYRRCDELPEDLDARYLVLGLLAGSNSATQSLAFALYGLLTGPSALWQDAARPDWASRELPRVLSLYQTTRTLVRVAARATEVAGCPYDKGQTAVVDIVGANACLRGGAEPGRLHMSFGSGTHKCPGSFLTEVLFSQAIPALARRFPRLQLDKELCSFVQTPMMQTPVALPCETVAGSRRLSSRLCEIQDMDLARQVVRGNDHFAPPRMAEHLTTLAERSGRDLTTAIRVARNALFFMDGERHRVLRDRIIDTLGASRLRDWSGPLEAAIAGALDGLAQTSEPDLVTGFADRMRQDVVAPVLGIFPEDPERFEQLAPRLQDVLEPWLSLRELERVQSTFGEALSLMTVPAPHAGPRSLLEDLLAARPEGFSAMDIKAVVLVLYGAGFNLSHTLANILHWILTRPPEERAGADGAEWIDSRLEDLIALCGSPKFIYRMARHDLQLGDVPMKTGDTARVNIQAVNREQAGGAGHLSFGHGLHRCVGAGLSRLVIRRAVPALFSRYPDIALVAQGQRYFPLSQTVALSALPCTDTPTENKKNDAIHRTA
ncbi:cytochrome P450 [Breoghania sp. L-A4]|uniref:cytochrome P450 n=1 Tax=Breoghania sp. L-A4 TaxID=2304600 RepID=UPI000E35B20E|nr:cytochrome P450 [Breoghania sp. L-A4]AXS39711.1 cytochrome P450 [Breoghania sp. L-A4]